MVFLHLSIRQLYMPFHQSLRALLEATLATFGVAVLIDCHSMPSVGGPGDHDRGSDRPDIVLGDRYGSSCTPKLTSAVQAILKRRGYRVVRNTPYAGGFNTEYYGRPNQGVHALQIEINRALYMHEDRFEKSAGFQRLQKDMGAMVAELGELDWRLFRPAHPRPDAAQ